VTDEHPSDLEGPDSRPEPPMGEAPDREPRPTGDGDAKPDPAGGPGSAEVPGPDDTRAREAGATEPAEPQGDDDTHPEDEPAGTPIPRAPSPGRGLANFLAEGPEVPTLQSRDRLRSQSRRDFLIFTVGALGAAAGAWWLLPDRARARLAGGANHPLDKALARLGLSRARREQVLDRALTFDDDVAEALYSRDRRVRTYRRSQVTTLPNNYYGRTPGPEYLPGWSLRLAGLASGRPIVLTIDELRRRFRPYEQVTRLVCVEGWSAIAWWGGIRFADFLDEFPPLPGARWAALRSAVNLSPRGTSDPYYVSLDLDTARHPQTLLATHLGGRPLPVAHGAPLRLLAPMKLGLKNIKAITDIEYVVGEPPDYWHERGYSAYDGL